MLKLGTAAEYVVCALSSLKLHNYDHELAVVYFFTRRPEDLLF